MLRGIALVTCDNTTVSCNAEHSLFVPDVAIYCFVECHYVEFCSMVATALAMALQMALALRMALDIASAGALVGSHIFSHSHGSICR